MSKTRWLISILLILVAAAFFAGVLLYRPDEDSESSRTLFLDRFPEYVTTPTVVLRGHVYPASRIEFTRGTSSLAAVDSGGSEFEVELTLEPGKNQIRVAAQTYEREPARIERQIEITWEPKTPSAPAVNALPATINVPQLSITGTTHPDGEVRVTISPDAVEVPKNTGSPTQSAEAQKAPASNTTWANAGMYPILGVARAAKDGSFQTKVRLPAAGPYKVTSVAYAHGVSSAASPELKFLYDPEWYPPVSSVEESKPPRRIARKADIVLAHKQMSITYEVTLPKDDPAFTALLANQESLDEFLEKTFYLEINDAHYIGEFNDVVPQIVIKGEDAIVTATTSPHRSVRSYLPVLSGELTLRGNNGFPFSDPNDSLSIRTYDYTIESVGPPPTLFDKNTLTWTGTDSRSLNNVTERLARPDFFQRKVKLQLAYKPFASPRNLLRLAQVSPFNYLEYPGSTIPHLVLGLCRLIPLLWVLWLFADSPLKNTIDTRLRTDLFLLSRALITLSLTDTILHVSRGLAYFVWNLDFFHGRYSRTILILEALASLAILLLALWLQLLTIRASRPWSIWLFRIAAGTRNAAFVCLLFEVPLILLNNPIERRVISFATIITPLAYFFFRTARVLKHGGMTPQQRRRLVVLAWVVTLTFPAAIVVTTPINELRWMLSQALSLLQSLLPYALAIGLLLVLKNVNTLDQRRTRHLVLTIGLILFSGFIVGPTANLFMIPIPFIISIWMFRNFLVHDFRKCSELDVVNSEVISDRRRLIDDVLSYETAQGFQANIEKLKEKVSSGDMTLKDFEDRKSQIEKYAYDKELASTHVNGLHAKTTVLGIGPNPEDWRNGRFCLKWGAALVAPFLIAYVLLLLLRPTSFSESVFGFMYGVTQLLTFVAEWLLGAFFFGYYFRYIRGTSGLEKGLRIACTVIICLLPTWITEVSSKTDLIGVFFRAGQTFLFFTLLGMAAFDYATFRNALRDQFRWRTFARFGNMPSFTAVVSVLITSIGVGLTSVVTGQFTALLTNLLNAAFPQAPGPPP